MFAYIIIYRCAIGHIFAKKKKKKKKTLLRYWSVKELYSALLVVSKSVTIQTEPPFRISSAYEGRLKSSEPHRVLKALQWI